MSSPTDVEIDRILNALSTTLNDQRDDAPEAARVQEIADGATAGERKLKVVERGAALFELHESSGNGLVAVLERTGPGEWAVRREREAEGSHVARPE